MRLRWPNWKYCKETGPHIARAGGQQCLRNCCRGLWIDPYGKAIWVDPSEARKKEIKETFDLVARFFWRLLWCPLPISLVLVLVLLKSCNG